jgi:predicted Fe-Mo cluster-binding NifX family protein
MKIAIPTSDGLTVAAEFINAKGFMALTLSSDKVIREEIRWSDQAASNPSLAQRVSGINDCDYVILREADAGLCEELAKAHIEALKTKEDIILNVVMEFVNDPHRKESNYCCCP